MSQRPWVALSILLVLGLITLAACGSPRIPPSAAADPPTGTAPAEGLPAATPTAPARLTAPPAAATATTQPTPGRPAVVQPFVPLRYDDFSQVGSGWTPLFVDQQGSVNGYSAEGFAFSTAAAGRLLYNVLPSLSFAPTRYSVDLQPLEGAGMLGLLLEVRGDPADYTSLAFFGVGLTTGGDLIMLVKGAAADLQLITLAQGVSPPLGHDAPAQLVVDRYDDRLAIRVAGGAPLSVAAPAPEGGTVGFFARADDRLAARFDNLLLTGGAPGDDPPCAGLRPLVATAAGDTAQRGEDVALVQRRLAHLGYDPGAADVYDARLVDAVTAFQHRNGLPAAGAVDPPTWCALLSGDAVSASDDRAERAVIADRYRPVVINLAAELPTPLLVSVRGAAERWQIALALPGRERLHYIASGAGGAIFDLLIYLDWL